MSKNRANQGLDFSSLDHAILWGKGTGGW